MADIARIVDQLNSVRARLESAVATVPEELWRKQPRLGAWSVAEVVAHLTMVEGAITDGAARRLGSAPRRVPLWKQLHLPVWLAEWRGIRRKTPIALDSSLLAEKDVMLARLARLRQRTLAFLEANRERELSSHRWPHPFFGSLNFYDWFKVVAHHEARHTAQIREIVESFQE